MKFCSTCDPTRLDHAHFQVAGKDYFREFFPVGPPEPLRVPGATKVHVRLSDLRPHEWIFFFAAQASEVFEPLAPPYPERQMAYGHLANSGMIQTNDDGTAHFWIYCPTLYLVEHGRVFGRHLHFVYYDMREQTWEREIYTYPLFCDVSLSRAQRWIRQKKAVWINALPGANDDDTIPGSLRLPFNENYTREDLNFCFGRHGIQWFDRLIIFCKNGHCTAAQKLKEQLDTLGFVNTFHFSGGLEEFKVAMMQTTEDEEETEDIHAHEKSQHSRPHSYSCLDDIDCPFNDPRYPSTYGRCVEEECDFSACSRALAPESFD